MAAGFRFECQPGCIECCRQKGFVYLTEEDLRRAAAYVGLSPEAFESKYVYRTRRLLRFRTPRGRLWLQLSGRPVFPRGARCPFLTHEGCSIHPAKPTQCRTFPFWPELVESRHEWLETARYCPGMGKGELVQIEAVNRQAQEMREGYPSLY
jgi:Fe-S-cluster containining protein